MSDKSRLRDKAWPEVTNSVWGVERRAVRDYMKTGWKEGNRALIVKINTRKVSEENAAKEEAGQILEFWKCKYPDGPQPETDSRQFANWMLRRYHDMCEEREKVDEFDHKVPGPRSR